MAKHFGERRDPTFGIWKKENADTDTEEHDPLTWGKKSPKRDQTEDELIAKIEGSIDEDDEEASEALKGPKTQSESVARSDAEFSDQEYLGRADAYFAKKAENANSQLSQRVTPSAEERMQIDIGKETKGAKHFRKRHLSKARINLDAQLRKTQKDQRTSV